MSEDNKSYQEDLGRVPFENEKCEPFSPLTGGNEPEPSCEIPNDGEEPTIHELISYTSNRTVKAYRMTSYRAMTLGITPLEIGNRNGYAFKEKGSEKWLPKDEFEKEFRKSETYVDRMKIEREELSEKIEKCSEFIGTDSWYSFSVRDANLLREQLSLMRRYFDILNERIALAENS